MDGIVKPIKQVRFRVLSTDNRSSQTFRFHCGRGQAYFPHEVEQVKSDFAAMLKGQHPDVIFKMVKVGANEYNVLHVMGEA